MPHQRSKAGLQAKRERDIRQGYLKARNSTELELVFAPVAVARRTEVVGKSLAAHRQQMHRGHG